MKRLFLLVALATILPLSIHATETLRLAGGDISLLPSYEQYQTPYKDTEGTTISDLVTYAATTLHWNACRVRLFVDPCIINPTDKNHQGEVQDLAYVVALSKRIKDAGMMLLLDFHYSDTWADPVKQTIPTTWQSLSEEELADTVYSYTRMCLQALCNAGATPDYVQIGNEVSYGMLWRGSAKSTTDKVYPASAYDKNATAWARFTNLLSKGTQAVREVCPKAQIVIHIERTADKNTCVNFYNCLNHDNVDYDIIGLSYYPFWHGTLTKELPATLEALHQAHPDKPIQIVETAYYNNYWPTSGINYDTRSTYPASPEGQEAYLNDLLDVLNAHDYVNGLYYWFPEENGCGGASYNANKIVIDNWLNRGLFDPNTHRAYAGLYVIGNYAQNPSVDVETIQEPISENEQHTYYTLLGIPAGNDWHTLPAGIYIHNGKRIVKPNF